MRPQIIGIGRDICFLEAPASVTILIVDDQEERARRQIIHDMAIEAFRANEMRPVTASMNFRRDADPVIIIESKREYRQRQQPFYRNLKKYRKP